VLRGYSAHEYSTLYNRTHSAGSSSSYSLPLDIRIETVVSVFLICFGLVTGADPLKPIDWNVWAGKIEKEGGARNPFRGLEERVGFLDIRVSPL
jgi:membrane magnesium transporter 1